MTYTAPDDFSGSDRERINAAIPEAEKSRSMVKIPPGRPDKDSMGDFRLRDNAVLLPGNMTLIISKLREDHSISSHPGKRIIHWKKCVLP